MKVGFTGTSLGMTEAQKLTFEGIIEASEAEHEFMVFHHGDCVGADEQADRIVSKRYKAIIEIHPPDNTKKQAHCLERPGVRMSYAPLPYLERNHAIVDATDLLIATPDGREERLRSGTWATIRYARKQQKKVVIIYPDGEAEYEYVAFRSADLYKR